ncbi:MULTISPECIES: ABC transporter ATP-binding protein [Paraclostridium]|uniref:ABC transporter ATP-binding protein n=1 Tax=Paraclostridium TaxID=1849822 RepID=UPI00038C7F17|nr:MULTISPECIES: ABC transporter ATP-binding protein [Paraclostridium]EQK40338.1 ABC transporter family protein [[Clostridium] bifermentans ATCC 19299] [Paraclostridium bifermentans ATCC 19299]MBZ6004430.1 ABC transporter ATP-binding protein [Paraclostridium bifermentans]MCE9675270.1 ABC transporter ATP-binding protein [Paraclostridium bifermentans]MCR1875913.1 ABC transporter ATP-binding protein [Paraclostridium bifermentans]MDU0297308.1 ABC transporter ATP-binding protein [Paraclostridium sp
MSQNIAEFNDVYKKYGKKQVLEEFNLNIPKGKIVGLLGPNGSGKTTMIKLLNGLTQCDKGNVFINGLKPSVKTKEIVSYLPDRNYLNEDMTVKELLKLFSDFYKDFDINKAKEMIKNLNLEENEKIKSMSKGTKEKVGLILVMSRNAKLYILDEPIGGVDPASRAYIIKTILKNFNEDSTLLIATHLINEIENICDEVIIISKGEILLKGNVDEIREEKGMSIDALFREEFKC